MEWTQVIGDEERSSWNDLKEATEYGATAIALLVIETLLDYDYFERNFQLSSGDYILKKTPLQNTATQNAVLEISGILEESTANRLEARLKLKEKQLAKGKKQNIAGYVAVVEFGTPKAKIIKK